MEQTSISYAHSMIKQFIENDCKRDSMYYKLTFTLYFDLRMFCATKCIDNPLLLIDQHSFWLMLYIIYIQESLIKNCGIERDTFPRRQELIEDLLKHMSAEDICNNIPQCIRERYPEITIKPELLESL